MEILKDKAWEQMAKILDKEMPQKNKRRRMLAWILPFLIFGAYIVHLTYLKDDATKPIQNQINSDKVEFLQFAENSNLSSTAQSENSSISQSIENTISKSSTIDRLNENKNITSISSPASIENLTTENEHDKIVAHNQLELNREKSNIHNLIKLRNVVSQESMPLTNKINVQTQLESMPTSTVNNPHLEMVDGNTSFASLVKLSNLQAIKTLEIKELTIRPIQNTNTLSLNISKPIVEESKNSYTLEIAANTAWNKDFIGMELNGIYNIGLSQKVSLSPFVGLSLDKHNLNYFLGRSSVLSDQISGVSYEKESNNNIVNNDFEQIPFSTEPKLGIQFGSYLTYSFNKKIDVFGSGFIRIPFSSGIVDPKSIIESQLNNKSIVARKTNDIKIGFGASYAISSRLRTSVSFQKSLNQTIVNVTQATNGSLTSKSSIRLGFIWQI